jgi:gamma-glutamyl hercynylcysteine S-oxide synthase
MTSPRLDIAWERSDALFGFLDEDAWLEQPIPLRQPFLFYLGHLPAFAWNHIARPRGERSRCPALDELFERGIDPVGVDSYAARAEWPPLDAVLTYRDRVRGRLSEMLEDPAFDDGDGVVAMVLEHELLHHETLLYMIHELPHDRKCAPSDRPPLPEVRQPPPLAKGVVVPEGPCVLGAPPEDGFRWDNERPEQHLSVPAFTMDDRPVTNRDYLEFVRDNGYAEARLWREEDWSWKVRAGLQAPHSWITGDDGIRCRTLFLDVPFEQAASWPAMTSWAEAAAYARWRGARLPTEAEHHRAAFGTPDGNERSFPWGEETPSSRHANVAFQACTPAPVGSCPDGASAWGIVELVGNGWEWTSSAFGPLPGFTPLPRYPAYSQDFFDDRHFVLCGGSWATARRLLRKSFRNWFQPHYPYVFTKFRCVI